MPRGYKGSSRVRGGSTRGQKKAKAPRGSSGSPGGKLTHRLTHPRNGPAGKGKGY